MAIPGEFRDSFEKVRREMAPPDANARQREAAQLSCECSGCSFGGNCLAQVAPAALVTPAPPAAPAASAASEPAPRKWSRLLKRDTPAEPVEIDAPPAKRSRPVLPVSQVLASSPAPFGPDAPGTPLEA